MGAYFRREGLVHFNGDSPQESLSNVLCSCDSGTCLWAPTLSHPCVRCPALVLLVVSLQALVLLPSQALVLVEGAFVFFNEVVKKYRCAWRPRWYTSVACWMPVSFT